MITEFSLILPYLPPQIICSSPSDVGRGWFQSWNTLPQSVGHGSWWDSRTSPTANQGNFRHSVLLPAPQLSCLWGDWGRNAVVLPRNISLQTQFCIAALNTSNWGRVLLAWTLGAQLHPNALWRQKAPSAISHNPVTNISVNNIPLSIAWTSFKPA